MRCKRLNEGIIKLDCICIRSKNQHIFHFVFAEVMLHLRQRSLCSITQDDDSLLRILARIQSCILRRATRTAKTIHATIGIARKGNSIDAMRTLCSSTAIRHHHIVVVRGTTGQRQLVGIIVITSCWLQVHRNTIDDILEGSVIVNELNLFVDVLLLVQFIRNPRSKSDTGCINVSTNAINGDSFVLNTFTASGNTNVTDIEIHIGTNCTNKFQEGIFFIGQMLGHFRQVKRIAHRTLNNVNRLTAIHQRLEDSNLIGLEQNVAILFKFKGSAIAVVLDDWLHREETQLGTDFILEVTEVLLLHAQLDFNPVWFIGEFFQHQRNVRNTFAIDEGSEQVLAAFVNRSHIKLVGISERSLGTQTECAYGIIRLVLCGCEVHAQNGTNLFRRQTHAVVTNREPRFEGIGQMDFKWLLGITSSSMRVSGIT